MKQVKERRGAARLPRHSRRNGGATPSPPWRFFPLRPSRCRYGVGPLGTRRAQPPAWKAGKGGDDSPPRQKSHCSKRTDPLCPLPLLSTCGTFLLYIGISGRPCQSGTRGHISKSGWDASSRPVPTSNGSRPLRMSRMPSMRRFESRASAVQRPVQTTRPRPGSVSTLT